MTLVTGKSSAILFGMVKLFVINVRIFVYPIFSCILSRNLRRNKIIIFFILSVLNSGVKDFRRALSFTLDAILVKPIAKYTRNLTSAKQIFLVIF